MADLPRDIGFDDDPVILISYTILGDNGSQDDFKPPNITSPIRKYRDRTKSESSILSGNKKKHSKSSVSSLSDDSCTSYDLVDSEQGRLNEMFNNNMKTVRSKSSLKSLEEEKEEEIKVISEKMKNHLISREKKEALKKCFSVEVEPVNDQVTTLERELTNRDKEIRDLRRQLQNLQLVTASYQNTSTNEYIRDGRLEQSHRATLYRLLEEQQISSRLKTINTELKLKVSTLESDIDKLHQQNLLQLQQLEQATSLAIAAKNAQSIESSLKPKKKSFFGGLRRSSRRTTTSSMPKAGSGSSAEQSPQLRRTKHSDSHLSLEGSFSEHDIATILSKKPESGSNTPRYNVGASRNVEIGLLETSLKLSMEEKSDLSRQLENLRCELKQQEDKLEYYNQSMNSVGKMTEKLDDLNQSLTLQTREKELLMSENEGLKYEIDNLRAEKENLVSSFKGKEVKAVLKEKQEMEFLRSENKALMSEVRTLISNSDNLETSLSQLKREMMTRDIREHELKLKNKRLDQDNTRLTEELEEVKIELNELKKKLTQGTASTTQKLPPSGRKPSAGKLQSASPERQLSLSSSSTEQPSPSTGQAAPPKITTTQCFKKNPPAIVIAEKVGGSYHERAQSEDLTSNQVVPMVRTSSGEMKGMVVQVTLPTKEKPTKLSEKSSSVPTLRLDQSSHRMQLPEVSSTLGSFINTSSSSSLKPAVNSLVKMFESNSSSTTNNNNTMTYEEEDLEDMLNMMPLDEPVPREKRFSASKRRSSTSSMKGEEERKREEEKLRIEQEERERQRKELEKQRREQEEKERKRKEQEERERQKKELEKQRREQEEKERKRKEQEERERQRKELEKQKKEQEEKERKRKEQEERERQKELEKQRREQEEKERKRKEKEERERQRKELEKQRREQEEKERKRKEQEERERQRKELEKQRREEEEKERKRKEQEERERQRKELEKQRREEEEKERKRKEEEERERQRKELEQKEKQRKEQEEKERKRKEEEERERQRKELEQKEKQRKEAYDEKRKHEVQPSDKCQTWPPKVEFILPATNTLPDQPKRSPGQSSPLAITKPKPPPSTVKSQSVPLGSPSDNTSGVVANLRSSWEKKCSPDINNRMSYHGGKISNEDEELSLPKERSGSFTSSYRPTLRITKTGSGPPGTVISPPSNTKVIEIKKTHVPPPLVKTESSPMVVRSVVPPTQNGVQLRSGQQWRRTNVEQIKNPPTAEDTNEQVVNVRSSPRSINRRPASLYVSTSSANDNRLSSLITILQEKQVKETTQNTPVIVSPPNTAQDTSLQNNSPISQRYSKPPTKANITRTQSMIQQNSPKLKRAASLASPLDRRTKRAMLLRWCQIMTDEYDNVSINNFGESFSDGLAFCALLHHFVPDKIPYHTLSSQTRRKNFEVAFGVAESLDIPSLLDIDDMVELPIPDWMSVMTYVSYIYNHFTKKS